MICPDCEYDLTGLGAGRCPECGHRFDPADPTTTGDAPTRAMRTLGHAFGWSAIAAVGLVGWSVARAQTPPFFGAIAVTIAAAGTLGTTAGLAMRRTTPAVRWTVLATSPAIVMLGLAISLAAHMRGALGGWPASIGMRGFPAPLRRHAELALDWFGVVMLLAFVVVPAAMLACAFVRRWRRAVFHLGAFETAVVVGFAAMLLMPASFLDWWWD